MGKELLVISCSDRKNNCTEPLPAIERYTGAWYEVINKLKRENKYPSNVDVVIISAEYGFVKSTDIIRDYDLRMTEKRARELRSDILRKFTNLFDSAFYDTIFINLGVEYIN